MLDNTKKFAVVSLGCRVNRAEVDFYSANLLNSGWMIDDVKYADIIIINTCTVTAIADKKTRQAVNRVLHQAKDNACIVVTGCSAVINSGFYDKLDKRIKVINKHEIIDFLQNYYKQDFDQINSIKLLCNSPFRTRASLKIQDGCDNRCSYCIVCMARGKSVSNSCDKLIQQVECMLSNGIKEIVLTGVNLGAYFDKNVDITLLCKKLITLVNSNFPSRIRLSSIEPMSISDEFIHLLSSSDGKICRFLHIPLQSGSSKVLKEMNRNYNAEQYMKLITKLHNKIPQIAISTDVIVGFPGETDSDFQQTFDLCKKCNFMKIHVFPYSMRQGTPAAQRKDQISSDVKDKRVKMLRELSDQMAKDDLISRKGTNEFVLYESQEKVRTESFHLIQTENKCEPGSLLKMLL